MQHILQKYKNHDVAVGSALIKHIQLIIFEVVCNTPPESIILQRKTNNVILNHSINSNFISMF